MPLRLDPSSLSQARLRAGVGKALEETAETLDRPPRGRDEAVHDARKATKRLRALYRLLAHADKALFARETDRLREIARLLAGCREPAALAETARWLATEPAKSEEAALLARMAAALEARREAMDGEGMERDMALAAAACRDAREGAALLVLPEGRGKMARLLARGWRRAVRRGRRALSPLTVDAPAEGFHALRKCAQTLNACHGLLKPLWPQALAARQDRLRSLIDTLGRENDIAGIVALMAVEPQHFGAPIEQVVLQRLLARRRQALRLVALQQAARVFDADPGEEARRIKILWKGLAS